MTNYFAELNSIDVKDKIEKKNGLSYLSWAYAWAELKKRHPDASYTVYENKDEVNYFTDGKTAWVKTGVTVNGLEHIEYLPVMDYRNKSIPVENITSFDVNKAIQRSLTKAVARHGLGLYIYAGEDLPEKTDTEPVKTKVAKKPKEVKAEEPVQEETVEFFTKDEIIENFKELIEMAETEEALKSLFKENKATIMGNDDLLTMVTNKRKEFQKVA